MLQKPCYSEKGIRAYDISAQDGHTPVDYATLYITTWAKWISYHHYGDHFTRQDINHAEALDILTVDDEFIGPIEPPIELEKYEIRDYKEECKCDRCYYPLHPGDFAFAYGSDIFCSQRCAMRVFGNQRTYKIFDESI